MPSPERLDRRHLTPAQDAALDEARLLLGCALEATAISDAQRNEYVLGAINHVAALGRLEIWTNTPSHYGATIRVPAIEGSPMRWAMSRESCMHALLTVLNELRGA